MNLWDAASAYFASAGPSAVLRFDLFLVLAIALLVPVIALVTCYVRDHRAHRSSRL